MRSPAIALRPARRFVPIILIPILAFVSLVAWGFSSPVGSSPDDDFHLASIWCGSGDRADLCEPGARSDERILPKDLVVTAECFAARPELSGSCQGAHFGTHPNVTVSTDRGNFAGLYPPLYYATMSIFAGRNIDVSVLAIRIFASLLFVGLLTGLYFLLPVARRSTMVWAAVLTTIPLGLFVIASTNPSGWAVLSAATLWVALLGYFETSGWRKIGLGAFATLSTVIGAGARADAAVFAGVAIVAVLIITTRRTREFLLSAILPLALISVALLFYFSTRQSDVTTGGLNGKGGPETLVQWVALFLRNLVKVPDLFVGVFGAGKLGWLDTSLPPLVWVLSFSAFVAVLFAALRRSSWRLSIASLWVLLALWLFPTVVLVQTGAVVGSYVQPRYILPLIVLLAGIVLSNNRSPKLGLSSWQLVALAAPLAAAQSLALYANIRRYVAGGTRHSYNLDSITTWWWDIAISPMGVWFIGSMAFTAMLAIEDDQLVLRPL
jgi:hypothetical protein